MRTPQIVGPISDDAPFIQQSYSDYAAGRLRIKVFVGSLLASLLIGTLFLIFTSPVYRSEAAVLVTAPVEIDQTNVEADTQRIAIQSEIMRSPGVLLRSFELLETTNPAVVMPMEELRGMLSTESVESTNLVRMRADGETAEWLQPVLTQWIEAYLDTRAEEVREQVARTTENIDAELQSISQQIDKLREEMNLFREQHDIVSAESEENASKARLRGFNQSLNTAMQAQVEARSKLEKVQQAMAKNERVVAESQTEYVRGLENELNGLRSRLSVLQKTYTADYIDLDPKLRQIPVDIAALEQELSTVYGQSANLALREAREEYTQANRIVSNLQSEFNQRKEEARATTAVFAEHQALVSDLADLEQLHRETLTRRTQIEAKQYDRQPQVSIISEPSIAERIWPNYWMFTLYVLGGALLLAIFVTWLVSWLQDRQQQSAITLSGINVYPTPPAGSLESQQAAAAALAQQSQQALSVSHDKSDSDQ